MSAGRLPWIGLVLGISFGAYGLLRKVATLGALEGLTLETMMLAPAAVAALAWWWGGSATSFPAADARRPTSGCVGLGPATTAPLLLFAAGARRLSMTTLGLLQYLSPTMQFLLGIWLFREPFGADALHRLRADLDRACALQRSTAGARARRSPSRREPSSLMRSAGGDHLRRRVDDRRDAADVAQLLRRQAFLLQQRVVRRDAEVALADDRRGERIGLELLLRRRRPSVA